VNFGWSSEDDAFRAKVRAFLKQELPADWDELSRHGPGSRQQAEFSRGFCAKLAAAGLLVPHWPAQYGGTDAPPWHHFILGEEMWAAGEPRGPQYYNVNWLGPTIMKFGSEVHKRRFLAPMAAGNAIWCQGFSEPEAGSDLASLRTLAESRGDDYVINGSKVWTSYAAQAEHCFLLARTGGPGKNGISILLVPMSTPGIVVRPIPSLLGEGDIHEVFFDNVVVPQSCRMGEEGQAWPIIVYALSNERVGIARYAFSRRMLDGMVGSLQRQGRFADPIVKSRAGQALAACEAARMLVYRVVDHRARGTAPGADASLARVAVVAADHAVADFALDFLPDALSGLDDPLLLAQHERAIASGIAAGAAEIQLNLIASSHLHLPREAQA
jgi:alkylation response protein AidB-like acyl-CoA dehydrogenase